MQDTKIPTCKDNSFFYLFMVTNKKDFTKHISANINSRSHITHIFVKKWEKYQLRSQHILFLI